MLARDDHDRLVAQLYAAAMGEAAWSDALGKLADAFGASAAILSASDASLAPTFVENHGYSPEFQAAFFASEAYANDPRPDHYRTVRPGQLYYDHALYDVAEMDRNLWVRESCEILKVKYQLGAVMSLPQGCTAMMTVLSTPDEGHASAEAIEAYRRLAPHMEQACSLGQVMEHRAATQAALLEALASKADGLMLLNGAGAPTFMNDAAAAILAASDGLALAAGGLLTRRGPETRRLQRMIGDAIRASRESDHRPGGQMLVTRPSGLKPYVAEGHARAADRALPRRPRRGLRRPPLRPERRPGAIQAITDRRLRPDRTRGGPRHRAGALRQPRRRRGQGRHGA